MPDPWPRPPTACLALAIVIAGLGCGTDPNAEPASIRLVDRMADATVDNVPELDPIDPIIWDFAAGVGPDSMATTPELGWRAIGAIEGLEARDGVLVGRTTGDAGVLTVPIPESASLGDQLHEIRVHMRASAGTRAGASFWREETLDEERILGGGASISRAQASTPIIPGDEMQSFALSTLSSFSATLGLDGVKHVSFRPTDAVDAEFAIESIRVVSRREHLSSVESGLGWQGQANVFRETVVTRTPERVAFEVELPSRPWLELHLGTIEPVAVTFRVSAARGGQESTLLTHTVTRHLAAAPARPRARRGPRTGARRG